MNQGRKNCHRKEKNFHFRWKRGGSNRLPMRRTLMKGKEEGFASGWLRLRLSLPRSDPFPSRDQMLVVGVLSYDHPLYCIGLLLVLVLFIIFVFPTCSFILWNNHFEEKQARSASTTGTAERGGGKISQSTGREADFFNVYELLSCSLLYLSRCVIQSTFNRDDLHS